MAREGVAGQSSGLAKQRPDLLVAGAISDPSAMPNYVRPAKGQTKPKVKIPAPSVWWPDGEDSRIAMIRATAIGTPVGDLHPELLSAGHAIIHDKIIVIDPMAKEGCAVITGSHNLGYKASYDNDENLLIIRGNQPLALLLRGSHHRHLSTLSDARQAGGPGAQGAARRQGAEAS